MKKLLFWIGLVLIILFVAMAFSESYGEEKTVPLFVEASDNTFTVSRFNKVTSLTIEPRNFNYMKKEDLIGLGALLSIMQFYAKTESLSDEQIFNLIQKLVPKMEKEITIR